MLLGATADGICLLEFTVPMVTPGTAFQQRVWKALREIPHGDTCSYSELAAAIDS